MSGSHGSSLKLYFAIFVALLGLTVVTVWVATIDMGVLNTPVALAIASLKAMLVILYFMHVKGASRLTWVYVASGFFFLVILLGFTFSDFLTRGWLPIYGA